MEEVSAPVGGPLPVSAVPSSAQTAQTAASAAPAVAAAAAVAAVAAPEISSLPSGQQVPLDLPRAKRKQVDRACANCRRSKTACSSTRPCQRCVKLDVADSCVDAPRKRRTMRKVNSHSPAGFKDKNVTNQARRKPFSFYDRTVLLSHYADQPQMHNSSYPLNAPLPSISSLPIANIGDDLHLFPESGVAMTTPYLQRLFSTVKSNIGGPSPSAAYLNSTTSTPYQNGGNSNSTTSSNTSSSSSGNISKTNSASNTQGRQYQGQQFYSNFEQEIPAELLEALQRSGITTQDQLSVLMLLKNNRDSEQKMLNSLEEMAKDDGRSSSVSTASSDEPDDATSSSETAEDASASPTGDETDVLSEVLFDSEKFLSETMPLMTPRGDHL